MSYCVSLCRVKELRKGGKSSLSHCGTGGKTLSTPSPKRNKHLGRGKSPTKKVKLGVQTESRGASVPSAGVLFSPGANLLCSTPKDPEEAGAASEVCLDHTTPLRGTLGRGRRQRKQRSERREEEEEEGGGSDGEGRRDQEARTRARPVWKETVPWETLRGHASSRRKERERGREGEREETERERHLRRYHEHLQQFLPSAVLLKSPQAKEVSEDPLGPQGLREPSPAEGEGVSRGRRGPSHAPHELGHGSRGGPEEGVSNAVDAVLARAVGEGPETPLFGRGRREDVRELGLGGLRLQGECMGWGEAQREAEPQEQEVGQHRRGLEDIMEGYRDRWTPVSPGAGGDLGLTGVREEVVESWDEERETERGSDRLVLSEWSTEEEDYSAYQSTESSSSSNNKNIPAERPLSPPRDSAAPQAENLNDLSFELKCSNSHPREAWAGGDPLSLHFGSPQTDSVNIPPCTSASAAAVPLTDLSRGANGSPGSGEAMTTSLGFPGELQVAVTSSTGAGPYGTGPMPRVLVGADTPLGSAPPSGSSSPTAEESSASTMDPLSISLLQVERQAATDSFLRPDSCSPCASPEGDGEERGGVGQPHLLLEALLDIQTYWGHFESAVAPDHQRGQQSFNLDSALLCMKGTLICV